MSDYDPFDLDAQSADLALHEASSRLAVENDDADLQWLMRTEQGRRIVHRFLERTGPYQENPHLNALQMARQEGVRSVGTWLLGELLRVCPELYLALLKDKKNGRTAAGNRSTSNN